MQSWGYFMGNEFKLLKDAATISATLTELVAVNTLITGHISSDNFLDEYESLLADILNTYRCFEDILQPLVTLRDQQDFNQYFSSQFEWYSEHYQAALSEPRVNAEFTFQKYLQFRKRRETKTGFPLLKNAFSRLHDYIDKWIDNDIWLAMTIDSLLKMLFRLLSEVQAVNSRDSEEAFSLYHSFTSGLLPFCDLIHQQLDQIERSRRPQQPLSMTR